MMEVLRCSLTSVKTSVTLLTPNKESKLSAISVVPLISKCFCRCLHSVLNGAIKTLGKKIYLMQKQTELSLQKYDRS